MTPHLHRRLELAPRERLRAIVERGQDVEPPTCARVGVQHLDGHVLHPPRAGGRRLAQARRQQTIAVEPVGSQPDLEARCVEAGELVDADAQTAPVADQLR
ncbi:MAG: hypothetical protein M3Q87_05800 [Actinomycetota bacterium]|nr:hypothetical protein [Actinomycetota bacterium]